MIEIIPAILEHSVADVHAQLERLQGVSPVVQIDLVGKNFLSGEDAMPLWDEFDFEFDLMLPHPDAEIEHCVALGSSRIVVHAHDSGAHEALLAIQHLRGGTYATEAGIALAAGDTPDALQSFLGLYDYVQVMGIAREGSQGQPFDERALALIQNLRDAHPARIIQVDGGVDRTNVAALVEAGASRLVVGHAIRNAINPKAELQALRELVTPTL